MDCHSDHRFYEDDWALAHGQMQDGEFRCLFHEQWGTPYVDYQGKSYPFIIPRWIE